MCLRTLGFSAPEAATHQGSAADDDGCRFFYEDQSKEIAPDSSRCRARRQAPSGVGPWISSQSVRPERSGNHGSHVFGQVFNSMALKANHDWDLEMLKRSTNMFCLMQLEYRIKVYQFVADLKIGGVI
jgi:hypothetical protein